MVFHNNYSNIYIYVYIYMDTSVGSLALHWIKNKIYHQLLAASMLSAYTRTSMNLYKFNFHLPCTIPIDLCVCSSLNESCMILGDSEGIGCVRGREQ